jgi:hypothetical protein
MTFLYFAYGSNMLPARLRVRCPSARVVSRAPAAGYDLEFSKISKDGSGKATLFRSEAKTPGVLFEIANAELSALDRAEGRGDGYERHDQFEIEVANSGQSIGAKTYLATDTDRQLIPYDWYLALVIAGAKHHALGTEYISRLLGFDHQIDPNEQREGRLASQIALKAHLFMDYRTLLNGVS